MDNSNPTANVEKKQKFTETLNALSSLEGAVERLENLTTILCGEIPTTEPQDGKMAQVDSVARLLSETPDRIARIEVDINNCTERLQSELN